MSWRWLKQPSESVLSCEQALQIQEIMNLVQKKTQLITCKTNLSYYTSTVNLTQFWLKDTENKLTTPGNLQEFDIYLYVNFWLY